MSDAFLFWISTASCPGVCAQHIKYCQTNSRAKRPPKPSNTGSKRIATHTFEQLIAYDNMRATKQLRTSMNSSSKVAKSASNILPPQSNILSHKLREKFAYLLNK